MMAEGFAPTVKPDTRALWLIGIISLVVLLAVYMYYGEVGWWLMVALYLIAASEKSLWTHRGAFVTVAAILLAHQLIAVFNIYGTSLPGADSDAESFLIYAQNRDLDDLYPAISIDLYRNFLILLLSSVGESVAVAIFSSVFAFTLALLLFNRLITLCGCGKLRIPMLLLFGLLPHVVVYTSITLREPWQLLFFIGMVYYGLLLRRESGFGNVLMFLLSATGLALLHQVLLPFAFVAAVVILIWPLTNRSLKRALLGIAFVVVIISTLAALTLHILHSERISGVGILVQMSNLDGEDFLRQLKGYRQGIDKDTPRTGMDVGVDLSSFGALARSMPAMYLHYWFAPMPWQIENSKDLIACILSLLRLGMILVILWGFSRAQLDKKLQTLLVTLFLLMCSTWILGTTNYGQAIRHQVLSDWLLILSSGIALSHLRPARRSANRTQSANVHDAGDAEFFSTP